MRGFILLPVTVLLALVAASAWLLGREGVTDADGAQRTAEARALRLAAEAGLQHGRWLAGSGTCDSLDRTSVPFGEYSYSIDATPDTGSPVQLSSTATAADGLTVTLTGESTRSLADNTTAVFQPAADAMRDTFIDAFKPTRNYGSDDLIKVDGRVSRENIALLDFDLGSLPPQSTIVSATLYLSVDNVNSALAEPIELHRLLASWTEGIESGAPGAGANWTERDSAVLWGTPGGDYDPGVVSAASPAPGSSGEVQWDITALVRDWHELGVPQHGFALVPGSSDTSVDFTSSDAAGTGGSDCFGDQAGPTGPRLVIEYACDCGAPCARQHVQAPPQLCDADYIPDAVVGNLSTAPLNPFWTWGITFVSSCDTINGVSPGPAGGWLIVDRNPKRMYLADNDGTPLTTMTLAAGYKGVALVRSGPWVDHIAVTGSSPSRIDFYDRDGALVGNVSLAAATTDPVGLAYIDDTASDLYEGMLAITAEKNALGLNAPAVHIVDQAGALQLGIDISGASSKPHGLAHLAGTDRFLLNDLNGNAIAVDFSGSVPSQYDSGLFGIGWSYGFAVNPVNCDHVFNDLGADSLVFLNDSSGGGPPVPDDAVTTTFGPVADTYVDRQNWNGNYGSSNTLKAGYSSNKESYQLLQFDVTSLPPGTLVYAAQLRVYTESWNGTDGTPMAAHQILSPWSEATTTWDNWGGSFDPVALDNPYVPFVNDYAEFDLPVELINEWIDGFPLPNRGVLLKGPDAAPGSTLIIYFGSREHPQTARRPVLEVTHSP